MKLCALWEVTWNFSTEASCDGQQFWSKTPLLMMIMMTKFFHRDGCHERRHANVSRIRIVLPVALFECQQNRS